MNRMKLIGKLKIDLVTLNKLKMLYCCLGRSDALSSTDPIVSSYICLANDAARSNWNVGDTIDVMLTMFVWPKKPKKCHAKSSNIIAMAQITWLRKSQASYTSKLPMTQHVTSIWNSFSGYIFIHIPYRPKIDLKNPKKWPPIYDCINGYNAVTCIAITAFVTFILDTAHLVLVWCANVQKRL